MLDPWYLVCVCVGGGGSCLYFSSISKLNQVLMQYQIFLMSNC